jgi:hypothetical protein
MDIVWGLKTDAIFDVWTIEHILSGISVGGFALDFIRRTLPENISNVPDKYLRQLEITVVLLMAFAWEAVEHYLETGVAGTTVEFWFQGVEFWPNRLLSDPLMLVLGYMIALRWEAAVTPARIASAVWILIHVFAFPHSMYLHEII